MKTKIWEEKKREKKKATSTVVRWSTGMSGVVGCHDRSVRIVSTSPLPPPPPPQLRYTVLVFVNSLFSGHCFRPASPQSMRLAEKRKKNRKKKRDIGATATRLCPPPCFCQWNVGAFTEFSKKKKRVLCLSSELIEFYGPLHFTSTAAVKFDRSSFSFDLKEMAFGCIHSVFPMMNVSLSNIFKDHLILTFNSALLNW